MFKNFSSLLLAVFLAVAGCAVGPGFAAVTTGKPWQNWQSSLHKSHPLAGKIWVPAQKRFIEPEDLSKRLSQPGLVLVGEIHDNPDHHRLQAWIIESLVAAGRKPAVIMEQIRANQAGILEAYLAKPDANVEGLGKALNWAKSGWPAWKIYQPIAKVALNYRLKIQPGDASRDSIRLVGKKGLDALSLDHRTRLALNEPLPPALQDALVDDLVQSHCNLMPRQAVAPLTAVQRLRDAVLADSLVRAAGDVGGVLIAGNGHVRSDRAVPYYLAKRNLPLPVRTVMLLEVKEEAKSPQDLIRTGPAGQPLADFVWFTPAKERADQCVELRKHFKKKKTSEPKK